MMRFWTFRPLETRLADVEKVVREARITQDLTLFAIAGALSDVPGIAGDFRAAASALAESAFEGPDPTDNDRVRAGRDEAVAILRCMAQTVEARLEKEARVAGGNVMQ